MFHHHRQVRFTLSFNPDMLPARLATPIHAAALRQQAQWWHGAATRKQRAALRLQHWLGAGWLTRRFTDADVQASGFCTAAAPQLPSLLCTDTPAPADVQPLLDGELSIFGHGWRWTADGSCWHQAPDTKQLWPQQFFTGIPIHAGNPYGDVRMAWEPSRLQHLVTLGFAAQQADAATRAGAAAMVEAQLQSWVAANPMLIGIHYISPMECALRLLAACTALDLVRPWLRERTATWTALLTLVFTHAELIRRRLGGACPLPHDSVAGAAALLYAGTLFPELDYAERWSAFGRYLLEEETTRYISQDGGGRTQGFGFHRFSTDLYGILLAFWRRRGIPAPEKIDGLFEQSRAFLDAFRRGPHQDLPPIGDGEHEIALSPSLTFSHPTPQPPANLTSFHLSGYSIIRGRFAERAIFDHGPLGTGPHAVHAHADALSLLLDIEGTELFIDPGTYTYTGDDRLRAYFRGTRAHNTVTVDGLDQAVQEGPLAWSHPFDTHLVYKDATPEGKVTVIARHQGYVDRVGVTHLRGLSCDPSGSWMIWDWLTGTGTHRLELNWHIACRVSPVEGGYRLDGIRRPYLLSIDGGRAEIYRGCEEPPAGWRSTRYGEKHPITTIRVTHNGPLPHEFMTRLRPL